MEALPEGLDRLHYTPGEGGLSPYEIRFGSPRPLAGIPYTPSRECEDAKELFARMRAIDFKVARVLNEKNAQHLGP